MQRPRASKEIVMEAAASAWGLSRSGRLPGLFVLPVRGYYRDTMGAPGKNDLGIYDDAFFIVSPGHFSSWNGNTDPSRAGWNPKAGKFMARLSPGVWDFRRLKHHANRADGYMAFGQGPVPVRVERLRADGSVAETETGCFGINLHRGGVNSTSSEGCLTVHYSQWKDFEETMVGAMNAAGAMSFPVILIDGPIV